MMTKVDTQKRLKERMTPLRPDQPPQAVDFVDFAHYEVYELLQILDLLAVSGRALARSTEAEGISRDNLQAAFNGLAVTLTDLQERLAVLGAAVHGLYALVHQPAASMSGRAQ